MVQRFPPQFGSLHEDTQGLYDFLLSAEILKAQRAQGILELAVGTVLLFSDVEITHFLFFKQF
jgi:hypothetical protein